MLRSIQAINHFQIGATDGTIGSLEQAYFDDLHWVVRYLVAETGGWLGGRKVLISPRSIRAFDWADRLLRVKLTLDHVRNSPPLDTDKPVSRQHEIEFAKYFQFSPYWGGSKLSEIEGVVVGPVSSPASSSVGAATAPIAAPRIVDSERDDPHLRSSEEVIGYHVAAIDGDIGHINDFLFDDETWEIRYLIIDTRNWWPGKHVLVAPAWIDRIDWSQQKVFSNVTRAEIESSPEYDPAKATARDYEEALHRHYRKPTYWNTWDEPVTALSRQPSSLAEPDQSTDAQHPIRVNVAMTKEVQVVRPDQSIFEAANMMAKLDVGALPVVENGRLTGIITDRDIVIRGVAKAKATSTTVSELMTPTIEVCYDDDSIDEVARCMAKWQIRRLPVLSRDKNLVGIIAVADLAALEQPHIVGIAITGISDTTVVAG